MKPATQDSLALLVRSFFTLRLKEQRGVTENCVTAYRDSIRLYLCFLARKTGRSCDRLKLEDLTRSSVEQFLTYLETERRNTTRTRNARLAAVRCFLRFVGEREPAMIHCCQEIVAIPLKKHPKRPPSYLEKEEVQAIVAATASSGEYRIRDEAIVRLLYNSGMRAQELASLNVESIRINKPYQVRIFGKGRKERTVPLWPETIACIKQYLKVRGSTSEHEALFVNRHGNRLTRFGIRHIVRTRAQQAATTLRSMPRNVHPHTLRHTTAMHLLQSNVDLATIRDWLGHSSIDTTSDYAEIDLTMKAKALESCSEVLPPSTEAHWKTDGELLDWLKSL